MKTELDIDLIETQYRTARKGIDTLRMAAALLLISGACGGITVLDLLPFKMALRCFAGLSFISAMVLLQRSSVAVLKCLQDMHDRLVPQKV
jgi:hypothetical protein